MQREEERHSVKAEMRHGSVFKFEDVTVTEREDRYILERQGHSTILIGKYSIISIEIV
jgi:hypothetical protein